MIDAWNCRRVIPINVINFDHLTPHHNTMHPFILFLFIYFNYFISLTFFIIHFFCRFHFEFYPVYLYKTIYLVQSYVTIFVLNTIESQSLTPFHCVLFFFVSLTRFSCAVKASSMRVKSSCMPFFVCGRWYGSSDCATLWNRSRWKTPCVIRIAWRCCAR